MTTDLAIVLALLAAAIVMFVRGRPRMDVVGVVMIVALPFTGVVTMGEALSGLSDSSIVLIAALFVIGEGLVRTGVARRLGDWLGAQAGSSETRLIVLLMICVAGLGSIMSSTAVVAIFIPVVLRIAQATGIAPARLMMPLSVAALVSGMLTLVATTPNLIVHAELMRQGTAGFSFLAITPFGLAVLVIAVPYMLLARRLLPEHAAESGAGRARPRLRDWIEQYGLAEREHRVRITPASSLAGKRLDEVGLRETGISLLAIERATRFGREVVRPRPGTVLEAGDILLVDVLSAGVDVEGLRKELALDSLPLAAGSAYFSDRTQEMGMVEVIVPAESQLVGRTVREAGIRTDTGLTVIGLRHGTTIHRDTLLDEKLRVGDTLLLIGFWSDIRALQATTTDLVVLAVPAELEDVLPAASKAVHALAILGLVVALMVSGLVPNVQAALLGCILMGATGCIDMTSAYRSISWKTLLLIVGMLPFSIALERTGGVDLAAELLLGAFGEASPRVVLTALFVITSGLGLFISNTATAILMAPVALAIAEDLGASPYPFAMIVALAASTAFMTPISSPVNTLVVGPGNYAFGDFVKVGIPLSVLVLIVCVILVPIILPLR